jgi:hypothetical protein
VVSHGFGFVVVLVLGAGGGIGTGVGISLGGAESGGNWGTVVGFLLAAVILWFGGRAMNRPRPVYDAQHGAITLPRNRHRLFWIPVQFFAPVALAIATVVTVLILGR